MWANQITASGDAPPLSIGNGNVKNESVSGYDVDQSDATVVVKAGSEIEPSGPQDNAGGLVDTPEAIPATLEPEEAPTDAAEDVASPPEAATATAPVAPLAFPKSDDAPQFPSPERTPSAVGVTFGGSVNTPPRSGTPDPDAEPKRKRISSQNLQKFARKMSLATRRAGSSSALRREGSSTPQAPTDVAADSARNSNDSPDPSIQSDADKAKAKKDKRDKRKSLF